jgi:hypothetical protein
MEGSPRAELLAEANGDENTRLRDAFAQAARVSARSDGKGVRWTSTQAVASVRCPRLDVRECALLRD